MFTLVLICDEEKIFEGQIEEINIITENGPVSILPQHQPYMAKISETFSYKLPNGSFSKVDILDGFLYTNGTMCFVVVDKKLQSPD